MTEINTEAKDALFSVVAMAQQELDDLLPEFSDDKGLELAQICSGHLDNFLWAAGEMGLDNVYLIVDAYASQMTDAEAGIDEASATAFREWLNHLSAVLESPDDPERLVPLLLPLSDEVQAGLAMVLFAGDEEAEAETPENADIWADEAPSDTDSASPDALTPDAELEEIDTDNMLGMLAFELQEVTPQLAELAAAIVASVDEQQLQKHIKSYLEIVNRIAAVAIELDLKGLAYICQFVGDNLEQIAALPVAERAVSLTVLRGWPAIIIDHLVHPDDDARCIAVIDYLESDAWLEPVPYRDQRELIEGLTRAAEIGGEFEVEAREIEASEEDVSLQMSEDASAELIEAFFAETPGHAESFSQLMAAISNGENIQNNVEAAQRIAHTLKGSGNLVGVKGIANLAHHIEDIFEHIAKKKISPPTALANTMQEAADSIENMIEYLEGMAPPPEDAQRILQDVLDWANRIDSGQMRDDDYRAESRRASAASQPTPIVERRREADAPAVAAGAETVRVPTKLLDEIFRIISETAITTGQIQERLNRLEGNEKQIRKNDGTMQQQRYELENLVSIRGMAARHRGAAAEDEGEGEADFDPLEMDEYDEFYGATHSFIESVADSREILRGFSSEVYELNALFLEQQRQNKELQQTIMTTRMVPVGNIASRLQRTLRQVCRATGKQAELTLQGQELLLDGDVLGKLADPLMHMLRNAVDHGIETAELREAEGKPVAGHIRMVFRQEGNNVVVSCTDDGCGLNYDRIRRVAIERGLLAEAEVVDNESLARLILQSGFSTSDKVTHVSGRGVGMDVVHNTIKSLNGSMEIEDAPQGQGTLVNLRLPITLLTSHCLLAGDGKSNIYAIPTVSLTQILSPGTGLIGTVGEKMTYQLDQDVYTARTLNSLIGVYSDQQEDFENSSVLLVQTADGVTAVTVERVVTSYDLVVKNMGAYIKSISGIAGVSMLGNGEVVPVLDLAAMLQAHDPANARFNSQRQAGDEAEVQVPKVLVVDDSLSVRNALSQLMQDSGYQPVLARDGLEAINLLESEHPDIVLTDLEMPRMNGLDLISYIRNSSSRKDMPVVMITSRNMAKHRQQAEQAGVSQFLPKPFGDDEVLDAIDVHLAVLA